jgi:hypothetical protein
MNKCKIVDVVVVVDFGLLVSTVVVPVVVGSAVWVEPEEAVVVDFKKNRKIQAELYWSHAWGEWLIVTTQSINYVLPNWQRYSGKLKTPENTAL